MDAEIKEFIQRCSSEKVIPEAIFSDYFNYLITGNIDKCFNIVDGLLKGKVDVKIIYDSIFRRSLYQIGSMWEKNLCSVSTEHLATAITERMLSLAYPYIFSEKKVGRKIIVSCVEGEYHQIGAKMVADIFEMNHWDSIFLGANTPADDLIKYIQASSPDFVGLSLSIYFNLPILNETIRKIRELFPETPVIAGGQGLRGAFVEIARLKEQYSVTYLESLDAIEEHIKSYDKQQ
ncbi:MAG: cobalamin-dependent protein [Candidatus Riflebacteria bacterium]|nr:cobalamin-dependent protein [Candidatus Riflebacteria bacterium]